MDGNETLFGVNFADGRIKGYPIQSQRDAKTFQVLYVREYPEYGKNNDIDNDDGTVSVDEFSSRGDRMFDRLDSNDDGVISADEMEAAKEARRGGRRGWRHREGR